MEDSPVRGTDSARASSEMLAASDIKILEFAESNGVLQFLLSRAAPRAIVADEDLLDHLRARQSKRRPAMLISIQDIDSKSISRPAAGPYYILTEGDEHAAKAKLRSYLASMGLRPKILGALNDLMPVSRSGRSNALGGFESAWESYRAIPRYMVLCAPRSGSEFLVRSLESSGIGAPREHMTAHFNRLLRPVNGSRPGGLDFIYWFVTLIHHSSVNGIFGTKIISHAYRNIEASLNSEEKNFLNSVMSQSLLVHLYRSDKLLQALSFDRALLTQFWHSHEPSQMASYRNGVEKWTYDYSRIVNGILLLSDEERYIHDVWKRHAGKRGMSICYESLDIDAIRQQLLTSLRIPHVAPVEPDEELKTNILRDEMTADYAERFMTEYRQQYVPSDPATHLPLRVTLAGGKLKIETTPDSSNGA